MRPLKHEIGWIRTNDEKSIDLQSIALTTQPLFLIFDGMIKSTTLN